MLPVFWLGVAVIVSASGVGCWLAQPALPAAVGMQLGGQLGVASVLGRARVFGSACPATQGSMQAENFAGVHDVVGVECAFDGAHHVHRAFTSFGQQEIHLVQTNAVFTRAGAF